MFDVGVHRGVKHVGVRGLTVGKGLGRDQHQLLDPFERAAQRVRIHVIALVQLDAQGGQIFGLGRIAHQRRQLVCGHLPGNEVLQGEGTDVSSGAGDEDLAHVAFFRVGYYDHH